MCCNWFFSIQEIEKRLLRDQQRLCQFASFPCKVLVWAPHKYSVPSLMVSITLNSLISSNYSPCMKILLEINCQYIGDGRGVWTLASRLKYFHKAIASYLPTTCWTKYLEWVCRKLQGYLISRFNKYPRNPQNFLSSRLISPNVHTCILLSQCVGGSKKATGW